MMDLKVMIVALYKNLLLIVIGVSQKLQILLAWVDTLVLFPLVRMIVMEIKVMGHVTPQQEYVSALRIGQEKIAQLKF